MKTTRIVLAVIAMSFLISESAFSQTRCLSGGCKRSHGILQVEGSTYEAYYDTQGRARGWTRVTHRNGDRELSYRWDGRVKGIRMYYFANGNYSISVTDEFGGTTQRFDFKPAERKLIRWLLDANDEELSSKYVYDEERAMVEFLMAINEQFSQVGETTYGWFDIDLDKQVLIYNHMWDSAVWQYRLPLFDFELYARNNPEGNPDGDVYQINCEEEPYCIEKYEESAGRLRKTAPLKGIQIMGPRTIDMDRLETLLNKAEELAAAKAEGFRW